MGILGLASVTPLKVLLAALLLYNSIEPNLYF